jgi:small conductance mechanosensitive channel
MSDSTTVISQNPIDVIIDQSQKTVTDWGLRLLGAIVILVIGLWVIGRITKLIKKYFVKKDFDPALESFIGTMVNIAMKIALVVSILDIVGVAVTSFMAILGSAGLAIGLAMSGTLSNFAGGVMLLAFKPFKIGDFIEAEGYKGSVNSINIFTTVLKTLDNKTVIIPNSPLSTNALVNYSVEDTRRLDFTVGIGYEDDIEKAKALLLDILEKSDFVLKGIEGKEHLVAISELADSSVNFLVLAWVKSEDYGKLKLSFNELVKKSFDANNISIPYPQTDIHLHKVN